MSNIIEAVNTTAMVLGYLVLFLLLAGIVWFVRVRLEAWRYKRYRARKHDLEWDNLRSAWIFDLHQDVVDTGEVEEQTPYNLGRVDTDVLDFTVDQIYDYQKEHRNDVA